MKHILISCSLLFAALCACNNEGESTTSNATQKETGSVGLTVNDSEDKTGTFSFDGKSVTGKVETQYFGDKEKGNYSVLCQHNEGGNDNPNFELLQIIFLNEKDATSNPGLKIYDGGSVLPMTEPQPGIVSVTLSGMGSNLGSKEFSGSEKSTGSIAVKNRIVEITDLSLYNSNGEKRTVNAKIPF